MRRRSSYSEARERRRVLTRVAVVALSALVVFELVSGLLVRTVAVGSASMAPGLEPGDLALASPLAYGGRLELFGLRLPGASEPARGDLALVEAPWRDKPSAPLLLADAVVRFLTFQRLGLVRGTSGVAELSIKRVIALPGDRVFMKDGVFRVRTPGASFFLTEFEVSGKVYELGATPLPEGWPADFPLSGEYPEVLLGKDEYFVACDDRYLGADSRAWGPVPREGLLARVGFRYWPFGRLGRP